MPPIAKPVAARASSARRAAVDAVTRRSPAQSTIVGSRDDEDERLDDLPDLAAAGAAASAAVRVESGSTAPRSRARARRAAPAPCSGRMQSASHVGLDRPCVRGLARGRAVFGSFAGRPGALASPQQAGDQVALRALGLYHGPIDGQVGPLTRAAVEAAQARAHLPVTGRDRRRARATRSGRSAGRSSASARSTPATSGSTSRCCSSCSRAPATTTARSTATWARSSRLRCARSSSAPASASTASPGPSTLARSSPARAHRHRPAPPTAAAIYVVQPGDSLTAIAAHYRRCRPRS